MSEASSYLESSIYTFGIEHIEWKPWDYGLGQNLFFSIYPAILIYLIEFQNVTFRSLSKSCERQTKAAPSQPIFSLLV
jgi:hypothetical protein